MAAAIPAVASSGVPPYAVIGNQASRNLGGRIRDLTRAS